MEFLDKQIAPPKSWEKFEDLMCGLFAAIWEQPATQKNGRLGQQQNGVDVYGQPRDGEFRWHGVQCKGKNRGLNARVTKEEFEEELLKAETFEPKLSHWTLVTTAPNDSALQEYVRKVSDARTSAQRFPVEIMFWDTILARLAEQTSVLQQFYPEHCQPISLQIEVLNGSAAAQVVQGGLESSTAANALAALKKLSDQSLKESGEITDDRASLFLQDLYITRDCEAIIVEATRGSKNPIFVTGAAGCGKTSTLWRIANRMRAEGAEVLFLRADIVTSDVGYRNLTSAPHATNARSYVIIDTVDAITGLVEYRHRFEILLEELQAKGYAVLASIRKFEKNRYFTAFRGIEIPADYTENEFPRAVESHVKAFYRLKDAATIAARVDEVRALVSGLSPVVELAYHPLTLRMLFSIYGGSQIPREINALSLYLEFWRRRVETDWRAGRPQPETDSRSLANSAAWLADKMLIEGAIQVGRDPINVAISLGMISSRDISELLSRGILRSVSSSSGQEGVEFFHQTFFEFSAAWAITSRTSKVEISDLYEHLNSNQFDSLRIPVLQNALGLGNMSIASAQSDSREILTDILRSQPEHLISPALFSVAQLPSLDLAIEEALNVALRNRKHSSKYIRFTSSTPFGRLKDVLALFQTLYVAEKEENPERNPRAVRFAVVAELPRIVGRAPELSDDVLRFLDENHVIEDVTPTSSSGSSHSTSLEVESVVATLFETSKNEPGRSSAAFLVGCRRLSDRSQERNASLLNFIVTFCHSEHAPAAVLRDVLTIISAIEVPKIERVRAFLEARLWSRERSAPYHFDQQYEITEPLRAQLVQCWSRGQPISVWKDMWEVFCAICEAHGTNRQFMSLWCLEIWSNLDKHPLEPSGDVSFRAYEFLSALLAEALKSNDSRQKFAAGQVCAYMSSQYLLFEVFSRIQGAAVILSENAAVEDAFIPALIGMSDQFDSNDARFGEIFKRKSARKKLIGATEYLLILRPDLWVGLTDFLVEHNELHRLEVAISTGKIEPRPLSVKARRDLAEYLQTNLSTEDTEERQKLARVAHMGLAAGLGLQLDPQTVFQALATEIDSRVRAWLVLCAVEVATESNEMEVSHEELLSVVAQGDIYVRDKATTSLVNFLCKHPSIVDVNRFIESISTNLNLRRVCEAARLVGAISADFPNEAESIGNWLLLGESVNSLGKTTLASFRIQSRYPFMIWFRNLPESSALKLIHKIPIVDEEVAVLIADLSLHSQYQQTFVAALQGFLQAEVLSPNLATVLGNFVRVRTTNIRPLQIPRAPRPA